MAEQVSDNSFESDVLQSGETVIVDFWAEWCGPCKALSPLVDELASEMDGKVKILKMNIDEKPRNTNKIWCAWHSNINGV